MPTDEYTSSYSMNQGSSPWKKGFPIKGAPFNEQVVGLFMRGQHLMFSFFAFTPENEPEHKASLKNVPR